MISGVSGTDAAALTILALIDPYQSDLIDRKKTFYILKILLYCIYKQWIYIQLLCIRGSDRRENAGLSFGVVEAPAH